MKRVNLWQDVHRYQFSHCSQNNTTLVVGVFADSRVDSYTCGPRQQRCTHPSSKHVS